MEDHQEMSIEVHGQIAGSFSIGVVKDFITDALKILPSYKDRDDSLVVIDPRRIAIILDKQANRAAVIPAEFIEQVVSGPMKQRLQEWLTVPVTPYYVMHLAGSWFSKKP